MYDMCNSFRSRIREPYPLIARQLKEMLRHIHAQHRIESRDKPLVLRGIFRHPLIKFRVVVAKYHGSVSHDQIHIPVSVQVIDIGVLRLRHIDRMRLSVSSVRMKPA